MTRFVYKGRRRTLFREDVPTPTPVLRPQSDAICRPIVRHPEAQAPAEPMPVWFAALIATRCQVTRNGADQPVLWNCVSGRALYTNQGADPELIEPLGVKLQCGQTLAVSWMPGDSHYTLEVIGNKERVA
ncbi:MAG TPA: hypothetical protein VGF59_22965 [Bryobacteraceae bacterium]